MKQRLLNLYLLLYTVIYYHFHKRGRLPGRRVCSYADGCAIGIHLPLKVRLTVPNLGITHNSELQAALPPFLKQFSLEYLEDIQDLHDCSYYWIRKNEGNNISLLGWQKVKYMFKRYVLNKPRQTSLR